MRTLARACGLPASLAAALAACSGEGSRSPTCGLALVAGPALIQQQLVNVPYVLTEAPRGLPGSLPARVIGVPQQGEVDRKSTRLNSSHVAHSYAVFCLK